MKTTYMQKMVLVMGVAGLALAGQAQDFSGANPSQLAPASAPVAQLPDGVAQVVRLAQAKVADDTIIAYVKSSVSSYDLDANQILYIRQQGVSDVVIATMLSQPKPAVAINPPPAPALQPAVSSPSPAPVAVATVAPTVTYVQTVPAPVYYYQPYYYPAYGVSPALSLSFAWGGGWHGGGWHGGGGWHH